MTSEILRLKIYSRTADLPSQERYALYIQAYFIQRNNTYSIVKNEID